MIFSHECWECKEHPLFMSRDDLILHKIKTHHVEYPKIKSYECRKLREDRCGGDGSQDSLDDDAAYLFALRKDKIELQKNLDRIKLEVNSTTGAKNTASKEITHLEESLVQITKIEKDFLTGCRYTYLLDNAQIYQRKKEDIQECDNINEEMMTILRQFNIVMAQKIVKQKVMSENLLQAKFDVMQKKVNYLEDKVEQQEDSIFVLEEERCAEQSLWDEKEKTYLKRIDHLEIQLKSLKNVSLKNKDKIKSRGNIDKEINSRKKELEIQKLKVKELTIKIKKLEDQQKTKDETLQKLQRELTKVRKQNNSLKRTVESQKSAIKDLEDWNTNLNTSNQLVSSELKEEKEFVDELKYMSEVQHQKMRDLLKENDMLYLKCRGRREKVKDQEFEIRELKEDRDFLKEDLEILKEEALRLEDELSKLKQNENTRERSPSLGSETLPPLKDAYEKKLTMCCDINENFKSYGSLTFEETSTSSAVNSLLDSTAEANDKSRIYSEGVKKSTDSSMVRYQEPGKNEKVLSYNFSQVDYCKDDLAKHDRDKAELTKDDVSESVYDDHLRADDKTKSQTEKSVPENCNRNGEYSHNKRKENNAVSIEVDEKRANTIYSPVTEREEFNLADTDALLSDLVNIGKRHKAIIEDADSGSANCIDDNDELMIVSEDCSADPQLLINETKEQIPDEKANYLSENETLKTTSLLLHLPPLNLKNDGGIIKGAVSRLPL